MRAAVTISTAISGSMPLVAWFFSLSRIALLAASLSGTACYSGESASAGTGAGRRAFSTVGVTISMFAPCRVLVEIP
jgi:hypothetical protein